MKKLWKRSEGARAQSLKIMKAALLLAVAIVSGVVILSYAGETLVAIGIWLLNLAVMIAIGGIVGSIAYTLISKAYNILMDAVPPKQMPKGIFSWTDLDTPFAE